MKVFVLDNYDSFTFNLVQHLGVLGADVEVERNDVVTLGDIAARGPDVVVISPGPGGPHEAGLSLPLVRWCATQRVPLLGVCLGHQAIGVAFGATVTTAPAVMHGKTSVIRHDGRGVFDGLPSPLAVMRYHSLMLDERTLDDALVATAWADDGVLMGLRHRELPIEGVQFHPESVLTPDGLALVENFLDVARATGRR